MQFDQLKRREFMTLFGAAAVWPLAASDDLKIFATAGPCGSL
jgi:hypothetical protein